MSVDPNDESSNADDELKWDRTQSEDWRRAVESWPWISLGGGDWEKSGPWERCTHEVTVTKGGGYIATIAISEDAVMEMMVLGEEAPVAARADDKELFFARCDCGEKHPGRPSKITRGCGRWALIDPPPDDA